eukprot:338642-Rhodomonas_salina.2
MSSKKRDRGDSTGGDMSGGNKRQKKDETPLKTPSKAGEGGGWEDVAGKLLSKIIKHRDAPAFNEPVDPVALDLPDYPDIVSCPMDYGTIKKRLEEGFYQKPTQFAKDMRLVVGNALQYNQEGDKIWNAARRLSAVFEDGWSEGTWKTSESAAAKDTKQAPSASKSASKSSARSAKAPVKVDPAYIRAINEGGWKGGASSVLRKLIDHESAWPFMQPYQGADVQ